MADARPLVDLDERIAAIRANISELAEQAAAYSGAGDEELMASRIADQEAELKTLTGMRDALLRPSA